MTLKKKAFENIVRKDENAGNQHFSPLPTMFSTLSEREIVISAIFILWSANALNLDQSEISPFDKESGSFFRKEQVFKLFWLLAFSPFPTMFSKIFYPRKVKNMYFLGED